LDVALAAEHAVSAVSPVLVQGRFIDLAAAVSQLILANRGVDEGPGWFGHPKVIHPGVIPDKLAGNGHMGNGRDQVVATKRSMAHNRTFC
jgi:hypothetical protein